MSDTEAYGVTRRMVAGQKTSPGCVIRLDRVVISGGDRGATKAPVVEGFRAISDTLVKPQSTEGTYLRLRRLRSRENSSQAFVQYQPKMPWLDGARITLVGDGESGITPREIRAVIANCANHRVRLVELAVDFDPATGVNGKYVRRFGRFGKSRRRDDRGGPEQERFGSRKSTKLVRSYAKRELNVYRVELELHSGLLRKCGIKKAGDLYRVASKVFPSHLDFVGVRWGKLEQYLTWRLGSQAARILGEARRRRDELSLRDALQFLSNRGVSNPHRFLKRLSLNDEIRVALRQWAEVFFTLVEELRTK